MPKIIFISGTCGSGKSTFADALARHLVRQDHKTVYVIHGDDFHSGFREPEEKGDFFVNGQASDQVLWEDILRFNWQDRLKCKIVSLTKGNGGRESPFAFERSGSSRAEGAVPKKRESGSDSLFFW